MIVRVPASSANLGPGFDSFGIAWQLYDEIGFQIAEETVISGCEERFCNEQNLAFAAYRRVLERCGVRDASGVAIRFGRTGIPVSRGLGSSAALIVAGVMAANEHYELGLSRDMLVVMGAQDQSSGAIGVGNVKPGIFSESTGGALMVCTTLDEPVFDEAGNVPCNYSDLGGYMIQGGAKGGIVIKWLRDTLCQEELAREAAGEGNAYDLMDQLAAATPPGAEGLFVMPFFGGGSNPTPDIYGRGVLYGLSLGHTRGHIIRAFLEATAVNIAMIVDYVEGLTGVKVTQIRSLGGGSLSPFWCQVKADVLGREVVTMANTQDAACLGAAIIAGYGAGIFDSIADTALSFAQIDRVYTPNPENRAVYDQLIKKYRLFVEATHGYTEELSKER